MCIRDSESALPSSVTNYTRKIMSDDTTHNPTPQTHNSRHPPPPEEYGAWMQYKSRKAHRGHPPFICRKLHPKNHVRQAIPDSNKTKSGTDTQIQAKLQPQDTFKYTSKYEQLQHIKVVWKGWFVVCWVQQLVLYLIGLWYYIIRGWVWFDSIPFDTMP